MSDASCPVCGGGLEHPRPVQVCAACHETLNATLKPQSTGEFTVPMAAIAALGDAPVVARSPGGGLRCSWCGRAGSEVKKLLTGGQAQICNECVALCSDILANELGEDWR